MRWQSPEDPERQGVARPPRALATLGLMVLMVLTVPAILYSITPLGPMKEGDVVYANGRHQVQLHTPERYRERGYGRSCFVEFRDALRVLQKPLDRLDGFVLTALQGRAKTERPFCLPDAELLVRPHQVVQKISVWDDVKRLLGRQS